MSNNVIQAKIAIRGIRPLFYHRFGPDALPLEKKEKSGVAGNNPEEWRATVMVTKGGQLYLDPTYVFSCIRNGSKYIKKGRGSIQVAVAATLQVLDNRILVNRFFPGYPSERIFNLETESSPPQDPELPVYLDVRGVVNPSTKGRNVRYRIAASPGWECEFVLEWDKTVVSRGEMESAIIEAGKLVGVGNGRAIGMGRFELLSFVILE